MRILVVSDTHGRLSNFEKVIKRCGPFDYVIHAGDLQCRIEDIEEAAGCTCRAVRGNCDFFTTLPNEDIVSIGPDKIFLVHGHAHSVCYDPEVAADLARRHGCNILIHGHTHVPYIDESDPEVLVMNPGSLTRPRQADARPSFIVLSYDRSGNRLAGLNYL